MGERTAAGLSSDPTLPGLRGLGRGRARASTDPGSDFPAAPHLLQLSLPHPPGCAMHPEGRGGDGASNGVRCIGGHLLRLQKY